MSCVPHRVAIGNKSLYEAVLVQDPSLTEVIHSTVCGELIQQGGLIAGRGRGGSVSRAQGQLPQQSHSLQPQAPAYAEASSTVPLFRIPIPPSASATQVSEVQDTESPAWVSGSLFSSREDAVIPERTQAQLRDVLSSGERALIRDVEWPIRHVDPATYGGMLLTCDGISEMMRGRTGLFLTTLLDSVDVLDPADIRLIPDTTLSNNVTILYLETLRRCCEPNERRVPTSVTGAR